MTAFTRAYVPERVEDIPAYLEQLGIALEQAFNSSDQPTALEPNAYTDPGHKILLGQAYLDYDSGTGNVYIVIKTSSGYIRTAAMATSSWSYP